MKQLNIFYVVLGLLICGVIGFLYFQNLKVQKQLDAIQVQNLQKREQQIIIADSVFTVKYNQKIQSTDSLYKILAKKDSLIDHKNKLQDEAIRNIIIPTNLLPKL